MTSFLGYNYTAYCSYLGSLDFRALTVEKLEGSNSLRVIMALEQFRESFWDDHRSFGSYVTLNVSHSDLQADFVESWSFSNERDSAKTGRLLLQPRAGSFEPGELVAVVFDYRESLQEQPIKLTLDFGSSRDPRVSTILPQTVELQALP